MKKRAPYWIVFFIVVFVALAVFWTTSNVYIYQKYTQLIEQMRGFMSREKIADFTAPLKWMTILLSLGFGVGMLGLGVFFVRLLREMRLSQLQKEFLTRISHELQSPVSSLELASSMLRSQGKDITEEEKESLWNIHDSELKRLRVEIESLLEASRWEHRGFKPQFERINFEDWLEEAFVGWEKIVGPYGRIIREGERLNFRCHIDPRIMLLITNNLVDNSRKYSRAGSLVLRLKTSLTHLKEGHLRWTLEFSDNGVGFPSDFSKKIFKRFEKAPSKLSQSQKGYGVGLYLTQQACRELGIDISAFSEGPGKGATFKISGKSEMDL